jgi:hypothetical protein
MGFLSSIFGSNDSSTSSTSTSSTTNNVTDATAGFELQNSLGFNASGGINAPITVTQQQNPDVAMAGLYTAGNVAGAMVNAASNNLMDTSYLVSENLRHSINESTDIYRDTTRTAMEGLSYSMDLSAGAMDRANQTTMDNARILTSFTQGTLKDISQRVSPNNLDIVKPLTIAGVLIVGILMLRFRK